MITKAQHIITYQTADSITYKCYLTGDWEKLINYGEEAIRQHVDFNNLRKRIGYAYFAKADYYSAQKQYEKALTFDTSDLDTRAYLYYCGINLADKTSTGFHASKLPVETQQYLGIEPYKLIDAVDAEYNYKANDESTGIRSNPNYVRIGISTKLSNRFNLYQAISQYTQTVNDSIPTKQSEYFASLNWSISSHTAFDIAYHYVGTKVNTTVFPGNLLFAKLSSNINRLQLGINSSVLTNSNDTCSQFGLNVGYKLLGNANIYIKSSLSGLIQKSKTYDLTGNGITTSKDTTIIFTQTIGGQVLKSLWAEASVTLGNLKNYNDNNALYLYNSLDATTFRTGLSLFYNLSKSISLVGNYTYDKKQIEDTSTKTYTNYNQHSFSTGIIWKL
jgi:tetratricopeptide (TPR) repeat protein